MAKLQFEDLFFTEGEPDEEGKERVKVLFLKNFYFYLSKEELMGIGHCVPQGHEIIFEGVSTKQAAKQLGVLLSRGFGELKSVLTDHDAVYIHRNSGIPLFGTLYFGIVDRGTNMIEVKPITGCNIDCIFCSVFEGKSSRKLVDYVVEKDYMLEEVEKLLDFKEVAKKGEKIDAYINTHGEPLLYGDIVGLVKGLNDIEGIGFVSIITNGLLLSEKLIDELSEAGLDGLNVSLNAVDDKKAKELAGSDVYDVERVKKMLEYAAKKMKVVIAPVYIKGVNEEQMGKLIAFAKSIGAEMGIQNYMQHKSGKKISEELGWKEFFEALKKLEEEHNFKLVLPKHEVFATKQMDNPFSKGDIVNAEIVCQGRKPGEVLAVAKERLISVQRCEKQKGRVKVKILKDKDGVFVGKPA